MFRNASKPLTTSNEIYEYALSLLDRREHGEKELVQKLQRRCPSAGLIREAVAKLKDHIKVDETGTEAWVATALQGRIAGLDFTKPETIVFHATHPFLYFIREWSTSTIFFIGQYMGS